MSSRLKFSAVSILIILVAAISCKKNSENKMISSDIKTDKKISDKNIFNSVDIIPQNTKTIILDTFENGNPMKIHFVDKTDTSIIIEKQFYKSGKLFIEGKLKNNKREGLWIAYYENGKVWSLGYFKNGLRDGKSEVYYDNGKIKYIKNYKNDVPIGTWSFYEKTGDLSGEIKYENGRVIEKTGIFNN